MLDLKPVPFIEAIRFFRDKVVLPADKYAALTGEAKAKAFSVSGITRMDVLEDLYTEAERALSEGITFGDFKKSLKDIMTKRGWEGVSRYKLDNIFRTNIQTAYQAGHYARQMEVVNDKPFWRYSAVMDSRTRPAHAAMHGKVLPYDHPWWKQNYPPNGFSCRCTVVALSKEEMQRDGLKKEKETPFDIFDKGWGHNPGAAMGEWVPEAMFEKLQSDPARWTPLITKGFAFYGLKPAKEITEYAALDKALWPRGQKAVDLYMSELYGNVLTDAVGEPLIMNKEFIDHLRLDGREQYLPLIGDIVSKPHEIWLQAEKEKLTNKVVLRKRYIAFIEVEKGSPLIFIAEGAKGQWLSYTAFYTRDLKYIDKYRNGVLIYGNE